MQSSCKAHENYNLTFSNFENDQEPITCNDLLVRVAVFSVLGPFLEVWDPRHVRLPA